MSRIREWFEPSSLPLEKREHPEALSAQWNNFKTGPYPTNTWWENLVLNSTQETITPYPYHVRAGLAEVAVCYPSREAHEKFIISPFHNTWLLRVEGMVKSGLIYHDEFSASIDYAGRQGASLRAWFVKGTPYQSFYVTQGCPILSTIHAILEVVRFPDNRRLLVRLNNGQHWSIFTEVPVFWEQSGNQLHTTGVFSGYLRLAYVPDDVQQNFHTLTQYSTCVPVGGRVIYEMDLEYLRIQYNFMTYGEGRLLMLTLPHHREVLENPRYIHLPGLSCIKGVMGAIEGNTWFAREPLVKTGWFSGQPIDRKFLDRIEANLEKDVKTHHHSPAPDPYFFGKGVAKMARLALIAEQIGRSELIAEVVGNLKRALEPWLTGGNRNPLVYDLTWKGIVSMQGLGDRGADFGNGWYNDHHYHYGYFIYAIAVVGRYDRGWLDAYRVPILAILKDYANPFHEDPMFPRFRHKDVYDGHSWASGLFEFADARNQESTSEAVNAYYAVYLLGLAWEDRDLQEAGQFLLSTELRSSRVYWQMGESSEIYDPRFKANKCVGIVWGCKVDYVTWFGDLPEYMHCIQYLPFTPITPLLLTPSWIHEQTGILERVLARKDPIVEPKWVAYILMALGIVDKDKASGRMLEVTEFDDGNTATNSWYWLATCGPCQ